MPGFSDNLRRAREAAGLSAEDLAARVGAAPVWLAHLEALDAALPELPHLVRLSEALGCSVDDLLAGSDQDFDHPRRRHAALLASRLGRISLLLNRLNAARGKGEITTGDERVIDEPAMLASVYRCRGWVTSLDSAIEIAVGLERELDEHLARIRRICDRAESRRIAESLTGKVEKQKAAALDGRLWPDAAPAIAGPAGGVKPAATPVLAPAAAAPASVASSGFAAPAAAGPPVPPADSTPKSTAHLTVMWSRPARGEGDYVCQMATSGTAVELRLVHGERVLASRACRNLDEAFSQSSAWKRVPDPEVHFAQGG